MVVKLATDIVKMFTMPWALMFNIILFRIGLLGWVGVILRYLLRRV